MVQEAKEGEAKVLPMGCRYPRLNKNRPTSITEPFAVFIQGVEEVNSDEWLLSQLYNASGKLSFAVGGVGKLFVKKKVSIKPIADKLFELKFENDDWIRSVLNSKNSDNVSRCTGDFALAYLPNKSHAKKGDVEKYWYIRLSDYESTDGISYTSTQIENSINEIISTQTTTKQLFASIVPQSTTQQNVQYVIVQQSQQTAQNPTAPVEQSKEDAIESDIDSDIPYSATKSENTFALVIANEDYTKVASVPFAKRDGKSVSDYITRTLGVDKGHISLVENATLNDMKYELKRLSKIAKAYNGEANLIVYYCGHGIPDEKNGNGYLLPIDGYGNDVSTAYSTQELYDYLGSLNVKRTILFMDACFSGASKDGDMLVAARGIAIKNTENTPSGNLIAFSACQGDETAYPYKEQGHGLMTYYLLKKIQESKGNISLGELSDYVIDKVSKTSIVFNGKSQTPTVSVSPNFGENWKSATIIDK
jgi:hypothetical protein